MSARRYEQSGLPGRMIANHNTPEKSASGSGVDATVQFLSRTDRRLSEQVIEVLRATGYFKLRDLSVIATDGCVILRGHVPSYYLKQVAQSAVRELSGVIEVRNELVVLAYDPTR
jgi:osmotically-inducible protein OsmY